MQIVIDIPNFTWIKDIKDFKKAVTKYKQGSGFDHAIKEALLLATPLPTNHGGLIDANELKNDMIRYGWHHADSTVAEYIDSFPKVLEEE